MGVVGIFVAMVTGWLAVALLAPARGLRPAWLAQVYQLALGASAGIVINGGLFFVLRAAGIVGQATVVAVDLGLLALLAGLYVKRRGGAPAVPGDAPPTWRWNKLLAFVLALTMLLAIAMQVGTAQASPFGEWDAFAIWNLRAKFLTGAGDAWLHAFSPLLEETHPEYPPLLSAFVARAWVWGGTNGSTVEPLATALITFWAVFALLASSLSLLRAPALGLLGCFVFLATGSYLRQSTWQYADIPLGLFILAALSLLVIGASADGRRAPSLLLAGGFASAAALMKDEGLPFLLLLFLCYLGVPLRREGRQAVAPQLKWLAIGALPGVLLLGYFKLFLAPDIGGVLRGQPAGQVIDKLIEPVRYGLILEGSFSRLVALGSGISHPVLLLVILAVVLRFKWPERLRTPVTAAAFTTALMIVAYWGVYLVTPDDLVWRIDTSLHRLYTQVWPSLLFVLFMVFGIPEDPMIPVVKASRKGSRKGR
jgi:hypothetical protein